MIKKETNPRKIYNQGSRVMFSKYTTGTNKVASYVNVETPFYEATLFVPIGQHPYIKPPLYWFQLYYVENITLEP